MRNHQKWWKKSENPQKSPKLGKWRKWAQNARALGALRAQGVEEVKNIRKMAKIHKLVDLKVTKISCMTHDRATSAKVYQANWGPVQMVSYFFTQGFPLHFVRRWRSQVIWIWFLGDIWFKTRSWWWRGKYWNHSRFEVIVVVVVVSSKFFINKP